MTRETQILWTSQGFWNTNPHVHHRSVDRVMEAQTQAEYDPHGWVYLHRFFPPFQAQKTRVSCGYQNGITLFPRQLENLIKTAPKLTALERAQASDGVTCRSPGRAARKIRP